VIKKCSHADLQPIDRGQARVRELFDSVLLVDVSALLLNAAAVLASNTLRTLDAIHLATLQLVDPVEAVIYDRRLADAVRALGYRAVGPGRLY
jgi:predicted nucleic acid-binding protein